MIANLNAKVEIEQGLALINKIEYDGLYKQFELLDQNIFNHKNISTSSNDRLEVLVDMMASMADLDFSQEAEVSENHNHLDYIAISLNLMRERLIDKLERLNHISAVFETFDDLYLIVSNQGEIIYANGILKKNFKINPSDIIGTKIDHFFDLEKVKSKCTFHFNKICKTHRIKTHLTPLSNNKPIALVTGQSYLSEHQLEYGYYYKVELQKKASIVNNADQKEFFTTLIKTYTNKKEITLNELMLLNTAKNFLGH